MVRLILFFGVLFWASILDIKKRIIPDWIHLLLIGVSLFPSGTIHFEGVLVAIPLLVIGIIAGGIGGGDIKLVGVSGLVLGLWKTFLGLIAGLCILLVFHKGIQIIKKIRRNNDEKKEQAYPLVPFLMIGMLLNV